MQSVTTKNDMHHRYHEMLWDYWNRLRGKRDYPSESEIDPDAIAEIWSSCFLINNDDVTKRVGYRYSYLGDALIEAYGDDVKNPDVALRLISTGSIPLVKKFDEVIKTQKPTIDESEFVNLRHVKIKYRACMLPLGTKEAGVTHILGCMRWKVY